MGKNKNKSNQQQYLKTDIDYDKLAEAIVIAHQKIKAKEEKEAEDKRNTERKEWLEAIGCKPFSENEKWIKRQLYSLRNVGATIISLFTFKRKNAKNPRLSFELMRLGATAVYGICELMLYILAVSFVVYMIIANGTAGSICLAVMYGFIAVLFARIVRIARMEVENCKDKEMLNMVFSANMTFVGTVLTAISLVAQLF